jgi:hypothetical protein
MNFLKIARSIVRTTRRAAETGAPTEVSVTAHMADGSGTEVEYAVECSVGPTGFDVSRVERVDTMQDVEPEAFKIMYGKAALEKLREEAEGRSGEIEEARAEEELGEAAPEAPSGPPMAEGPPAEEEAEEPAEEPVQ